MSIVIQEAWYGAPDETPYNVTSAVSALFGSPQHTANFTVGPAAFGLSGLPAKTRYFSMTYTYTSLNGGLVLTKSASDGTAMTVNYVNPSANYKIIRATYGTPDIFLDLTDRMNLLLQMSHQACEMTVGSNAFLAAYCSGDPAPQVPKFLTVTYTDSSNNTTPTICAPDFTTINLAFPLGNTQ